MDPIRVFLIGRKSMCLEGLAAILGTMPDVEIAGRGAEWPESAERARTLRPDVVIVDMAHCTECGPAVPVTAITALEGLNVLILGLPDAEPGIVAAFEAGALGYLSLTGQSAEDVHRVVSTVARGEAALDPRLSARVLARMRTLARTGAAGPRDSSPTDREHEVLQLLVAGLANKEIATSLHVSESTVKNHLHALYSKLGVESRSQAVSEAIRRGLATP